MLEARNTPVDNYKSPAKLACVKGNLNQFYQNNLTVKSVENDGFKQKRWCIKSKQKKHYDQHTKEQKMSHTGETEQMFLEMGNGNQQLLLKS